MRKKAQLLRKQQQLKTVLEELSVVQEYCYGNFKEYQPLKKARLEILDTLAEVVHQLREIALDELAEQGQKLGLYEEEK